MKRILIAFLISISIPVTAQQLRFWDEIRAFKTADSIQAPPKKAILFVGSSSFRRWHDLQQFFPDHTVINRGFGGSSLPHLIQYADKIILPYKPKQIVIYCGENDFVADSVTAQIVADRFKALFRLIRADMPGVYIAYVSIKPSPSRRHVMQKTEKANSLIRAFLQKEKRTAYVDIWDPMLDDGGEPRKELFVNDMLHMNAKGYAIWQAALKPVLIGK